MNDTTLHLTLLNSVILRTKNAGKTGSPLRKVKCS